jgi:hypothetical protein
MDAQAIIGAVTDVTKDWSKLRKAEERAAARTDRRTALIRPARVTLKEAVFSVMEEAIERTSGAGRVVFPKRNLFYTVRRLIQGRTLEELAWKYFEGPLLAAWEKERGRIDGMYCDPRGYFIEPHTGTMVQLGTRQVESYQIPAWRYDKIIYIEKKGFHALFKQAQIAERYDLGIMCAEGYSSEAGKLLLSRAERSARMDILCFHDADPYGYNIARKLRHAARLGRRIQVIDAGLKLGEALDMGLEPEVFHRDRALPQGLELDDQEREHFEGEPDGWHGSRQQYRCLRVELNDLASDPDRFLSWVEAKLEAVCCNRKLLPPRKVVLGRAKDLRSEMLFSAAREELSSLLDLDGKTVALVTALGEKCQVNDLYDVLAGWSKGLAPESWDAALRGQVALRVDGLEDKLREAAGGIIDGGDR